MIPTKRNIPKAKANSTALEPKKSIEKKKPTSKPKPAPKSQDKSKHRASTSTTPPPSPPTNDPTPPPSSHQFTFPWLSERQQAFCIDLQKKPVKPTLLYSPKDAKLIGVDDCLQGIARKYGWTKVLNMQYDTYPKLTYEFLSSFVVGSGEGDVVFYLGGVK